MTRYFKGNAPAHGELVATFEVDGEVWRLYTLDTETIGPWRNLKLIRVGRGLKSNFHLAWNRARFAQTENLRYLMAREPKVYAVVAEKIVILERAGELDIWEDA